MKLHTVTLNLLKYNVDFDSVVQMNVHANLVLISQPSCRGCHYVFPNTNILI